MTRRLREEDGDRYTYLYIPERYKEYKQEEKAEALQTSIKELNARTVYLHLTNFSKYTRDIVSNNKDKLGSYPNIIIDLRDNLGGDISAMKEISDMFLAKGDVIAVDKLRLLDWTYKSRHKAVLKYDNIIILQNSRTASSSENMIAALKDNLDNVVLIGEKTYGKGIGQYTLELKRGFAVKATVLLWYTPGGVNIHGKGINPDIPYSGDDIIGFSLGKLGEFKHKQY